MRRIRFWPRATAVDEGGFQKQEVFSGGGAVVGGKKCQIAATGSIGDQDQMVVIGQSVSGEPRKGIAVRRIIRQIVQDAILVEIIDDVRIAQIGQPQPMFGQHMVHFSAPRRSR